MPSRRNDQDPESRSGDRVAKLLARAGIASRREVERMIAEGRVARDGVPIDTPATTLPSLHGVTVDGQPVQAPAPARLFLYHKPVGLLVTERDPRGRPTIYDRLPKDLPRVVPVGRLDLNTEGLLLLTTDGGFKRQLELPASGVERTYRARAYGHVTQEQLEALIHGIEIEGIRYGSIDANLERRTGANVWVELTLTEGKNREVRRVLEHLGLKVGRLIRTRYGPFLLGDLPAGDVGEVRQADLVAFRQTLGRARPAAQEAQIRAEPVTPRQHGPRAPFATPARPAGGRPGRPAGPATAKASKPPVSTAGKPAPVRQPRPARPEQAASSAKPVRTSEAGGDAAPASGVKPKRKPGWARPKPRTSPGKPRR